MLLKSTIGNCLAHLSIEIIEKAFNNDLLRKEIKYHEC